MQSIFEPVQAGRPRLGDWAAPSRRLLLRYRPAGGPGRGGGAHPGPRHHRGERGRGLRLRGDVGTLSRMRPKLRRGRYRYSVAPWPADRLVFMSYSSTCGGDIKKMSKRLSITSRLLAALFAFVLVAAACGGDDDGDGGTAGTSGGESSDSGGTDSGSDGGDSGESSTGGGDSATSGGSDEMMEDRISITLAIDSEPTTLDPQITQDGGMRRVMENVYERLIEHDPRRPVDPVAEAGGRAAHQHRRDHLGGQDPPGRDLPQRRALQRPSGQVRHRPGAGPRIRLRAAGSDRHHHRR